MMMELKSIGLSFVMALASGVAQAEANTTIVPMRPAEAMVLFEKGMDRLASDLDVKSDMPPAERDRLKDGLERLAQSLREDVMTAALASDRVIAGIVFTAGVEISNTFVPVARAGVFGNGGFALFLKNEGQRTEIILTPAGSFGAGADYTTPNYSPLTYGLAVQVRLIYVNPNKTVATLDDLQGMYYGAGLGLSRGMLNLHTLASSCQEWRPSACAVQSATFEYSWRPGRHPEKFAGASAFYLLLPYNDMIRLGEGFERKNR